MLHKFSLDDETYYALLRLCEAEPRFTVADDYLKKLVLDKLAEVNPPKGILEKIRDGEPLEEAN